MPHKTFAFCKPEEIAQIQLTAKKLRRDVINMLLEAESGHSAGALGMAEIFASLYFHVMHITPSKEPVPKDKKGNEALSELYKNANDQDRLVLSNGHICPIWYATLAHKGFFPTADLKKLRKINSPLQGHPHSLSTSGVENSGGPLGQGLSQAIGMAISAKLDGKTNRIYCIGSDGELNEGQTWEAAMFAGNNQINNLTWIIDRNNIQIDGYTEDIMPLESIRQKLEAFKWYVIEIDGHNVEEIINSCNMAYTVFERPTVIIAHTIPGKDVDFMQYKFEWHGKPPNKEEAKEALKQIRSLEGRIKCYDYD